MTVPGRLVKREASHLTFFIKRRASIRSAHQSSVKIVWFPAALLSLALCATCFAIAPGIIIKNPSSGNLVAGNSVTFSGEMIGARSRNADQSWNVKFPNVALEFYYNGYSMEYLITSTQVGMAFPDPNSARGAWIGALTIQQIGGMVFPYELYAVPLDPFNDKDHSKSDSWYYAVVAPDNP